MRNECERAQDHMMSFGNHHDVSVFQHLSECGTCTVLAGRISELDPDLRALRSVSVPDEWVRAVVETVSDLRDSTPSPSSRVVSPRRPPLSTLTDTSVTPRRRRRGEVLSLLAHAACLLVLVAWEILANTQAVVFDAARPLVTFYDPGPSLAGGGGGGGDAGGVVNATPPDARALAGARPVPAPLSRYALAPREMELVVGDARAILSAEQTGALPPSWDVSVGDGGLLETFADRAGLEGGAGGGRGPGSGPGTGSGVGEGSGGGSGGGLYSGGGGWDVDPLLIVEGPRPAYPAKAREQRITGEVVLQISVAVDGTTEVLRVLHSLPHCVQAAIDTARHYRWKPALKDGKPVEAIGILMVRFDLVAQP